jgi:hypothetical protein
MNEKSITALPFNPTIGVLTTFLRAASKLASEGSFAVPLEVVATQADEPAVADIANSAVDDGAYTWKRVCCEILLHCIPTPGPSASFEDASLLPPARNDRVL